MKWPRLHAVSIGGNTLGLQPMNVVLFQAIADGFECGPVWGTVVQVLHWVIELLSTAQPVQLHEALRGTTGDF